MAKIGYALSSEEHGPGDLVRYAKMAEDAGFLFALISDHYHPWSDRQGHSPFVWSVIGGIAQVTTKLELGTGVTCPSVRIHPAIIAQAAATAATMMPGRFSLGVGTGENLNEHILGDRWPPHDIRIGMLEEAVEIIRYLWEGQTLSYWGDYFQIEDARVYTLPDSPPPILVAGSGPTAIETAGRIGDGFIGLAPEKDQIEQFEEAGGEGKPRYGQLTVCWGKSEKEARKQAFEIWPNSGLSGELNVELRTVAHFEQAYEMLNEKGATRNLVCGPDEKKHLDGIQAFIDAGYDHVYVHQIGPDQAGFLEFYKKRVLPEF